MTKQVGDGQEIILLKDQNALFFKYIAFKYTQEQLLKTSYFNLEVLKRTQLGLESGFS